jgi:hypothetical protein
MAEEIRRTRAGESRDENMELGDRDRDREVTEADRRDLTERDREPDRAEQRTVAAERVGDPGPGVAQQRQRDEYGGFNIGAAFFGWLVAVGIAVILTALLSAAGAAIGLTQLTEGEAKSNADTISIVGGILLVLVLAIAYYAGGYVAGRMSRFDGARQGLGAWVIGLLATIALAILGAVAGSEYNLFSQLNLPRIPIDEGSLATGAGIALVAILLATLAAAIVGGKAGERYHRKVDRVGYEAGGVGRRERLA